MPKDPYELIGQMVLNKYGGIGMIISYDHVIDSYKIEWYNGSAPYVTEHQEHKTLEYISNYDLYEKMQIYRG